jgi:hypothetical protein
MLKKSLLSLFLFTAFFTAAVAPAGGKTQKPRPPLDVSVAPVQEGLSSSDIKPGDVVEFKLEVRSFMEAEELQITIRLSGGAELVAGDISWTGPVAKNEDKTLAFTVRSPLKGRGKIDARISVPGKNQSAFTANTRYILGPEPGTKKKSEPSPRLRQGGQGKDILEYPANP